MSRRTCEWLPFVDLVVVGRSALSVDVGMRSSSRTRRACARSASASPRGGGASPPTLPGPSSSSRARRARTCAASCSSSMGCVFLSFVCLSIARPLFYASVTCSRAPRACDAALAHLRATVLPFLQSPTQRADKHHTCRAGWAAEPPRCALRACACCVRACVSECVCSELEFYGSEPFPCSELELELVLEI